MFRNLRYTERVIEFRKKSGSGDRKTLQKRRKKAMRKKYKCMHGVIEV